MFPQHVKLYIAKNEPNFRVPQLYSQLFTEVINRKGLKHEFSKPSSLQIEQNNNYQLKEGHQNGSQILFQFCRYTNAISLKNIIKKNHDERLWKVLGQGEQQSLRVGDSIKIGVSQLLVYGLKTSFQQKSHTVQFTSEHNCRICLQNICTNKNPLLNLCKCDGSLKFIHLKCIRQWLMTRLTRKNKNQKIIIYKSDPLECELCKSPLPKQVLVDGKIEGLISFQNTKPYPFIVFQINTLDKKQLQIKVFIKCFLESKFSIGNNSSYSDFVLPSFGVSPYHCNLYNDGQKIFIKDLGSIAGTLVTLHQRQYFMNNKGIHLQYGQLLLKLKVKEPFFTCFCSPQQQYALNFQTQYSLGL